LKYKIPETKFPGLYKYDPKHLKWKWLIWFYQSQGLNPNFPFNFNIKLVKLQFHPQIVGLSKHLVIGLNY